MPTISTFYGITIMMYPVGKEHNPPHIYAKYQEHEAKFSLLNGEKKGEFPQRASEMVKEFIRKYQKELLNMWETGIYTKLKGLD